MPPHRVYLEPFAGGAAVLFRKPRAARETLNDPRRRRHAVLRALRGRPDELAAAIATTPYSLEEWALCRRSGAGTRASGRQALARAVRHRD
jgi:DNA adenine methylase